MVRCASGVTRIRQRAVGGPSVPAGTSKSTPTARMSWREDLAQLVVADLADEAGPPPNEATPATVLAAEPPEDSTPGPIAS